MKAKVEKFLEAGVTKSRWPHHMGKSKRNGDIRLRVDMRQENEAIIR